MTQRLNHFLLQIFLTMLMAFVFPTMQASAGPAKMRAAKTLTSANIRVISSNFQKRPIDGILIQLFASDGPGTALGSVLSHRHGRGYFGPLKAGRYRILASGSGYRNSQVDLVLAAGGPTTVEIILPSISFFGNPPLTPTGRVDPAALNLTLNTLHASRFQYNMEPHQYDYESLESSLTALNGDSSNPNDPQKTVAIGLVGFNHSRDTYGGPCRVHDYNCWVSRLAALAPAHPNLDAITLDDYYAHGAIESLYSDIHQGKVNFEDIMVNHLCPLRGQLRFIATLYCSPSHDQVTQFLNFMTAHPGLESCFKGVQIFTSPTGVAGWSFRRQSALIQGCIDSGRTLAHAKGLEVIEGVYVSDLSAATLTYEDRKFNSLLAKSTTADGFNFYLTPASSDPIFSYLEELLKPGNF